MIEGYSAKIYRDAWSGSAPWHARIYDAEGVYNGNINSYKTLKAIKEAIKKSLKNDLAGITRNPELDKPSQPITRRR